MATTTALLASANALVTDNSVAWNNPTNAYTDDTNVCGTTWSTAASDVHSFTDFGFDAEIGASDTIDGVTVEIKTLGRLNGRVLEVDLYDDGIVGTSKTAFCAESDQVKTFGGASDLWGATLTAADVRASTFGVAVQVQAGNNGGIDIYYIKITVDYTASGGGTQTITGSDYVDADSFGSGTVSPGAVSITGSDHVDPDTFGAGEITSSAGIAGAAHSDPDSFGAGSVTPGGVTITGATYGDADSFGSGEVSVGTTITGAAHEDGDSFGAGSVSAGPVTISGSAHTDDDAFGSGDVSVGTNISGSAHVDTDEFGAGSVGVGPVGITGTNYDDADEFGSGTLSAGPVTVTGAAHSDVDSFGSGAISLGASSITGAIYSDPDAFGPGAVSVGPVTITGAAYDDPDAFGAGLVLTGNSSRRRSAEALGSKNRPVVVQVSNTPVLVSNGRNSPKLEQ